MTAPREGLQDHLVANCLRILIFKRTRILIAYILHLPRVRVHNDDQGFPGLDPSADFDHRIYLSIADARESAI